MGAKEEVLPLPDLGLDHSPLGLQACAWTPLCRGPCPLSSLGLCLPAVSLTPGCRSVNSSECEDICVLLRRCVCEKVSLGVCVGIHDCMCVWVFTCVCLGGVPWWGGQPSGGGCSCQQNKHPLGGLVMPPVQ